MHEGGPNEKELQYSGEFFSKIQISRTVFLVYKRMFLVERERELLLEGSEFPPFVV